MNDTESTALVIAGVEAIRYMVGWLISDDMARLVYPLVAAAITVWVAYSKGATIFWALGVWIAAVMSVKLAGRMADRAATKVVVPPEPIVITKTDIPA